MIRQVPEGRAPVRIQVQIKSPNGACGAELRPVQGAAHPELSKLRDGDSPLKGLKADEVRCRDAGLCKADEPQRFETYAAILARASREDIAVDETAPPPLETQHWSMRSWGAMFCEVRVNAITGEPCVSRFLGESPHKALKRQDGR